ncbi:hypothetical protein [Pseudomonas sp. 6D_7.1_Bac1]|uniref:hypothetical protein n=1 Tax=Pseudomonas sp. 6D_7.1_Bac1 TaxID=2971615 RepID=UPI0021CABCCC|nr:hypothetical protein [Pseudomonas sp. 6D_7.1_Bac1]MCU1750107.1 hypothetical protein [Pseudomonas sp. 6D_7.1_Bac1]
MHKATYALLILVCAGSTASLCQVFKNEAYRPNTALLNCASATNSCYPPLVRNLLP